ncbi:hypothetical protein [Rhodovulum marinum]|uniref:hypothetical protein n=1 Tax=Rhodovulum marinum TaxID=320662 RepID=UPI00104AA7DA|nr:hypothetical protein [Rhodovulum marinum]
MGPLRLRSGTGRDITPRRPLLQAILAVLVTARDQSRPRSILQEMFWGAAPPDKAAASLRNKLYELRKELAPLGGEVLMADRHAVWLAPGRIRLDPARPGGPTFLEGMDLRIEGAELFEDWLREMRAAEDPAPSPTGPAAPALSGARGARRIALGLLPSLHAGLSRADLIRADGFPDAIARLVAQTTTLDVHDLRGHEVQAVPLPVETGQGATHFLQARVERRGKRLNLTFRLHEASARRLVWVSDPLDALAPDHEETVCALAETLLQQMAASPAAEGYPDLFPWTALTALFSLDGALIDRTEATVERMLAEGGPAYLDCVRLFAQVFKLHEGVARPERVTPEALVDVLAAMPPTHPLLPLCQSLAGYSAHMLMGENDLAEALVDEAARRAPNLALNLDHLAVMRLMRGDLDGAGAAHARCLRAGAASPWRYTYDVTGAMVSMARGDVRGALTCANRALMRKPRFLGALRYAMAGFALAGNAGDARRMQARIATLRPGHDLSDWTENLMRRTPPGLGARLSRSLRDSGLV